jgi:aromatase
MKQTGHREVEHQVAVDAPAATVYQLIAEAENWPRIFPPVVHVDRIERTGDTERLRMWATANGKPFGWTSARVLDPAGKRVEFRQEVTTPPVAAMGGSWLIEPVTETTCLVRLIHEYRAVGDDPEGLAYIAAAVEANSQAELAALKASAEQDPGAAAELMVSFQDTVWVDGAIQDVYDYLNDAHLWAERLPHVDRISLTEETPGLQILAMDTRIKDGSPHTTTSIRVCFPLGSIVYKQIGLPAPLTVHTGYWQLTEHGGRVSATSQHTAVLNAAYIPTMLGPDATTAQARAHIQDALSTNSLATLGHAKEYAESRR